MQHSEHGESLKSRICYWCCRGPCCLHSIILQKNAFFISNTVKTSNHTVLYIHFPPSCHRIHSNETSTWQWIVIFKWQYCKVAVGYINTPPQYVPGWIKINH